jgi:hypothetical protein
MVVLTQEKHIYHHITDFIQPHHQHALHLREVNLAPVAPRAQKPKERFTDEVGRLRRSEQGQCPPSSRFGDPYKIILLLKTCPVFSRLLIAFERHIPHGEATVVHPLQ